MCGHYIGFRKINDEWFHFDDGVVHRVQILHKYNVNLVVYRRNDTPAFMPPVDLSGIPHLQKSVVLNRKNSGGDANDKKTPMTHLLKDHLSLHHHQLMAMECGLPAIFPQLRSPRGCNYTGGTKITWSITHPIAPHPVRNQWRTAPTQTLITYLLNQQVYFGGIFVTYVSM